MEAQSVIGLEYRRGKGELEVGLRHISLKISLVGCNEGWEMRVGPSKSGLGFNGPFKALVLPVANFEARAKEESQREANNGKRSVFGILEGDPMLKVAPLLTQTESTLSEVARAEFKNEVLLEEASRYDTLSHGCVKTLFLSSTPFLFGRALVAGGSSSQGGLVPIEEESSLDPLSIILANSSEKAMDEGGGRDVAEMVVDVGLTQEVREFGDQWNESSLVKFSKYLGFSLEGFEGEFLSLLQKIKIKNKNKKK